MLLTTCSKSVVPQSPYGLQRIFCIYPVFICLYGINLNTFHLKIPSNAPSFKSQCQTFELPNSILLLLVKFYATTLSILNTVGHTLNKETNTNSIGNVNVDAQYIPTHIM